MRSSWWKSFFNKRVTIGYYTVYSGAKVYGWFCWLRMADSSVTLICNPWPFVSIRRDHLKYGEIGRFFQPANEVCYG